MRWVFGETGQLRCVYVKHNRVGELEPPNQYTIMDDIVYVIKIETKVDGKWVTYEANDVQLEFIRIDPFIRKTLKFQGNIFKDILIYLCIGLHMASLFYTINLFLYANFSFVFCMLKWPNGLKC